MEKIPTKADVLDDLLSKVEDGEAVLIVGLDNPDIPTIHNFYPQKYWKSIKHLGFGCFEGKTEHGKFKFNAGGAMNRKKYQGGRLSWTYLSANPEVLKDLGYDLEAVTTALQQETA